MRLAEQQNRRTQSTNLPASPWVEFQSRVDLMETLDSDQGTGFPRVVSRIQRALEAVKCRAATINAVWTSVYVCA